MSKINETYIKNWTGYLLETLVIIISILSAFMLDSWHEERKERKFEHEVLIEIRSSIHTNIEFLDRAIRSNQRSIQACQLILDYFDSGLPYNDSLDIQFSQSLRWFYPSLDNNAYESLKSYGLHLITNDSIREELGKIYEWKFVERLSMRQDEYFNGTVAPLLTDWFESYDMDGEMKPLSFNELRMSTKYRHILKTMISNRKAQNTMFKQTRSGRIHLDEMIERELNKNWKPAV